MHGHVIALTLKPEHPRRSICIIFNVSIATQLISSVLDATCSSKQTLEDMALTTFCLFIVALASFLYYRCDGQVPSTITLRGIMRDMSAFNRDFQTHEDLSCLKWVQGLVEPTLYKGFPSFIPPVLRPSNSIYVPACAINSTRFAIGSRAKFNFDEFYK
jgi:hypothetical protein